MPRSVITRHEKDPGIVESAMRNDCQKKKKKEEKANVILSCINRRRASKF